MCREIATRTSREASPSFDSTRNATLRMPWSVWTEKSSMEGRYGFRWRNTGGLRSRTDLGNTCRGDDQGRALLEEGKASGFILEKQIHLLHFFLVIV